MTFIETLGAALGSILLAAMTYAAKKFRESLKRQEAKQALEYSSLQNKVDEQKELITVLQRQLSTVQRELDTMREELSSHEQELEAKQQELARAVAERDIARDELREVRKESKQLQVKYHEVVLKLERALRSSAPLSGIRRRGDDE